MFIESHASFYFVLNLLLYFLGSVFRRLHELLYYKKNGELICGLNVVETMPKRSKSNSSQTPKRSSRILLNSPPNIRPTIPRSCKLNTLSENLKEFEDVLKSYQKGRPKPSMAASPFVSSTKEKQKKPTVKDEGPSVSGDELDVVFDIKEDKKNRVYEVINVASDDETPNKVTYERLYADDPEQRVVLEVPPAEEKKENKVLLSSDLLGELVKETNTLKAKERDSLPTVDVSKIAKKINPANPPVVETVDSDDDIICVAVLDPKTKAEQKKASIEEICLSSDSECETVLKVPPIKVKIPPNSYNPPYYTPQSYYSTSRPWLQTPRFGYRKQSTYLTSKYNSRKRSDSNSLSDWESSSPNPFSDESSSSSKSVEARSSSENSQSSPNLKLFSSEDENSNDSFPRSNLENDPDSLPWHERGK